MVAIFPASWASSSSVVNAGPGNNSSGWNCDTASVAMILRVRRIDFVATSLSFWADKYLGTAANRYTPRSMRPTLIPGDRGEITDWMLSHRQHTSSGPSQNSRPVT